MQQKPDFVALMQRQDRASWLECPQCGGAIDVIVALGPDLADHEEGPSTFAVLVA